MTPPQTSPSPTLSQEGNLYKTLQKLILNQASGKLVVHNPQDSSVRWRIYLGNGRIHFAGSETGQSERLNYLLGRYVPQKQFKLPPSQIDDYQYMCDLWHSGEFSFHEIRAVLAKFTQEAFVQILSLRQSLCYFESTVGLENLLLYLNIKKLMHPVEQQIRQWLQLRSDISSPFQRPMVADFDRMNELTSSSFWMAEQQKQQLQQLQTLMDGEFCLYDLAHRSRQNVLNLSLMLHPLIKGGAIKLGPYYQPKQDNRPIIACVDDSPSIQRVVKFTLEASGYQVISIKEPFKALTTLLRSKPSLILMDINMPEIDGYQLCGLCNKSAALKDIPIVMLTGRTGLIDRVKAKMAGSVGYICKPFLPQDLVETVGSYVNSAQQI
ncbi:MAG: response regulator [Microcystaceae cyanobacterium]